ncbi:MAG: GspE/PulE family protein [bacterium]|nr:GspE/PulE family protein [bacterium]
MNIIQLLQEKRVIDQAKAHELLADIRASGKKQDEIVLEQKLIDEDTLYGLKSEALNIPLRGVNMESLSLKVLGIIPEDSARYYRMIPLSKDGSEVEIGMVYPEDLPTQEALKFLARREGFSYRITLITPGTFSQLLKQYKTLKGEVGEALRELEDEMGSEEKKSSGSSKKSDFQRLVGDAPITKLVAVMLRNAVEGEASDIHIEPSKDSVRVRFRLLGQLYPSLTLPLRVHQSVIARIKILSGMKIDETRIPQDGRFSTSVGGKNIDFRVSTFPTPFGEKAAIRVLDPTTGLKTFADLGLEGSTLAILKKAAKEPYGLILVTGPTGSGKTTTLYAILREVNTEQANIVSLEDPVEYYIAGVNQSQVRPDIGYDFAQGLRQILRQDPDIIMVGEIRDEESAGLVVHAALTGHLVFSTLHTNNAISAIPRLLDMGVDRYLLPATLTAIISQRLVRRLCDKCKEKESPSKAIEELIREEVSRMPVDLKKNMTSRLVSIFVYRAKGCKVCNQTGYAGRIGIFESLEITSEIGNLISQSALEEDIAKVAFRQGMATIRQDGIMKALDGVTTIEEVLRVTKE